MEFGILGPLEVRSGGQPVDLGPYKQRALLALLLLHVDRVVPTDRILEELWGEDGAGKEKALWVHISRLRSALEPARSARGQSTVLVTRDNGYSIRTDPDTLDAHRFESAVGTARRRIIDDPDGAAETLRDALALWRGSALQDFTYDGFAQVEISRLEELRLDAIETRIEADLRRGLTSELVGELEGLTQRHPLRERPVSQLMHALYRAGRQAEALRAFERYRTRIVDELGLDPSPELRRLEEQILLHDLRLTPSSRRVPTIDATATNPFKGLHAFHESDAGDFFGRDRLVADVLSRLGGGARLVALVGPSGSGKSSVARAGVVPAVRKGAVPGSERWLVASMVPGAHPFAELEAALLRSTIDAPDSLDSQLADPVLGLLRAALRLLPHDTSRLLLLIDQFEELFTVVDDETERRRFIANLVAAVDDPQGRVCVVLTLRADEYHRPLAYSELATHLGPGVINILPLTTDELEEAAQEPASRHGATIEAALLTELLTDVIGEPGALPVFQYTLTELFDRRRAGQLSLDTYRSLGGVRGVLSRRADDVFHGLTLDEQEAARQLFLRLVTITEHEQWSRRRVPASEILALDVDVVAMESVIDRLGRHRFLAFDRDHGSGAPTVEVAHEALLSEWDRLREWIEDARDDITRRAALDAARVEWSRSERHSDYLLSGKRLAEYERWRRETTVRLTVAEHEYLDASVARRDEEAAAESARAARESGLARRARRRLWALLAVVAGLAVAGAAVILIGPAEPAHVGLLLAHGDSTIDQLMVDGLDRAARDFDVDTTVLDGPFNSVEDELGALAGSGTDLVVVTDAAFLDGSVSARADHPGTTWAFIDPTTDVTPAITFAEHEGAYLAGAAAALTSETDTIGFVGGFQYSTVERFRAGFEAGARAVDPSTEILAAYAALDGSGFDRQDLAHHAAVDMYERGADVVFHAAGAAGSGVFAAAREESEALGRHVWAIGVDADQYLDVPTRERPHVLTSMVKRFDVAVYELVRDHLDGGLDPAGRVLTLADGAVGYSTTGGHLSPDTVATLDRLEADVVAGRRVVPAAPSGRLLPPASGRVAGRATVTFDGTTCRYDGPTAFRPGEIIHIELVNSTRDVARVEISSSAGTVLDLPAPPGGSNEGYAALTAGGHTSTCNVWPSTGAAAVPGPTLQAPIDRQATSALPAAATAEEVAMGFLEAHGAYDAERAIGYLTDDALAELSFTPDDFAMHLAMLEAQRYEETSTGCAQLGESAAGTDVRCTFDVHLLGSDDLGRGPYTGNYWDLTVRDSKIVSSSVTFPLTTNGLSEQMWEPFADWILDEHPADVAIMYTDGSRTMYRNTEESIRLWDQRIGQYVADVSSG